MKINWKIRFKNPLFWATVLPSLTALIYTILGAFGVVPTISKNEVTDIIGVIISGLTTLGVLVDPTTTGVSDSDLAMTYIKPKGDDSGDT